MPFVTTLDAFSQSYGQSWGEIGDLALAFGLASLIGLEREARQRSAGLRTHTLVGVGAALFMLVSKNGFWDVLGSNDVILDPSRVAAQVVSGIGFIGGGLIFVRRDAVRGLTTAAGMWLTAAIGMACGGGLPVLALLGTAAYFIVVFAYTPLVTRLPGGAFTWGQLRIEYVDQRGVLRRALEVCGGAGFTISDLAIVNPSQARDDLGRDDRRDRSEGAVNRADSRDIVGVTMGVHGSGDLPELVVSLSDLDGVVAVSAGDAEAD